MGQEDRAGFVLQIMTSGTLLVTLADAIAAHGPIDALKSDKDITVNGTPAEAIPGETIASYKIAGNLAWDPVGWQEITAISGTSPNVWAAWYNRKPF